MVDSFIMCVVWVSEMHWPHSFCFIYAHISNFSSMFTANSWICKQPKGPWSRFKLHMFCIRWMTVIHCRKMKNSILGFKFHLTLNHHAHSEELQRSLNIMAVQQSCSRWRFDLAQNMFLAEQKHYNSCLLLAAAHHYVSVFGPPRGNFQVCGLRINATKRWWYISMTHHWMFPCRS